MTPESPYEPVAATLSDALDAINRAMAVDYALTEDGRTIQLTALKALVTTALLSAQSGGGLGECRRNTPYSPLRPIIDHQGKFKWCCNHHPQHCAGLE